MKYEVIDRIKYDGEILGLGAKTDLKRLDAAQIKSLIARKLVKKDTGDADAEAKAKTDAEAKKK